MLPRNGVVNTPACHSTLAHTRGVAQDATDETGAVLGVGVPAAELVPAARRGLRCIRQRQAIVMLLGVALFVAGMTWFGHAGSRSKALADSGVHTVATVVDADLYDADPRARFTHRWFTEHVDVRFKTVTGQVVTARCYIGEDDMFAVGGPVDIVYDQAQPTTAQLAEAPSLGPTGAPFFYLVMFGAIAFAMGFGRYRLASRGLRALSTQGRPLAAQAIVSLARTGWEQRIEATNGAGATNVLVARNVGSSRLTCDVPTTLWLYGPCSRRQVVVVIGPSRAILLGRVVSGPEISDI